jgi:hypothetical protein
MSRRNVSQSGKKRVTDITSPIIGGAAGLRFLRLTINGK